MGYQLHRWPLERQTDDGQPETVPIRLGQRLTLIREEERRTARQVATDRV